MDKTLKDFVQECGIFYGYQNFQSKNYVPKEDDWIWILNDDWVQSLPKILQSQYKKLSDEERCELATEAWEISKETYRTLIENEKENLKDSLLCALI